MQQKLQEDLKLVVCNTDMKSEAVGGRHEQIRLSLSPSTGAEGSSDILLEGTAGHNINTVVHVL